MKKTKKLLFTLIVTTVFFVSTNVFAETTYDPETRIKALNTEGTTISTTDHENELRFIGANPNNYVSFNGQKWRIIGVFDGKLKIVQDSIGKYAYDTSKNTVNNGTGVNQWGGNPDGYQGADLMKLLNPGYSTNSDLKCKTEVTIVDGVSKCGSNTDSDYTTGLVNNSLWWNAQSGYCYNWGNYSTTACDFTNAGLKTDTARNMIDEATWYLGTTDVTNNFWGTAVSASTFYNLERSNVNGKKCTSGDSCNDTISRTTTWKGKVGLIYPSDYAYATSGGTTNNRNACLANFTINSNATEYSDCKDNDWLSTSDSTWTITPIGSQTSASLTFILSNTKRISLSAVSSNKETTVRPTVYLKSNIKFTTGNGTKDNPFILTVPVEETECIPRMGGSQTVINFETNGGILKNVDGEEIEQINICKTCTESDKDLELPQPTKEGYKFEGWYNDEKFSKKVTGTYRESGATPKLENVNWTTKCDDSITTLYAKWSQVVKTGNTGINKGLLLIIIGSLMIGAGSAVIYKKTRNNN